MRCLGVFVAALYFGEVWRFLWGNSSIIFVIEHVPGACSDFLIDNSVVFWASSFSSGVSLGHNFWFVPNPKSFVRFNSGRAGSFNSNWALVFLRVLHSLTSL